MKISTKYFILTLFVLLALKPKAQELNCRITVNHSQIQGSNKTVFEDLQKALFEFMNNYTFTNHVYSVEERVECNFLLNITKQVSSDEFKGNIQITSSRPVYNTSYKSPLLNHVDSDIQFRYAEGTSLEFSPNSHNELTSLFAYYAYIILGLDYDSYSPLGGATSFELAQQIVTTAQSSAYGGWKSFDDQKNRYWLIENYLNSIYSPLREYNYTYHRKGLDKMSKSAVDGRAVIAAGLPSLLKIHRQKPNSMAMLVFFQVKSDEFIKLLSESPSSEGMRAYNLLKEIDQTNASKYEQIIKK